MKAKEIDKQLRKYGLRVNVNKSRPKGRSYRIDKPKKTGGVTVITDNMNLRELRSYYYGFSDRNKFKKKRKR